MKAQTKQARGGSLPRAVARAVGKASAACCWAVLILLAIVEAAYRLDQLHIISVTTTTSSSAAAAEDNFANSPSSEVVSPSSSSSLVGGSPGDILNITTGLGPGEGRPIVGIISAFTDDHRLEAVNLIVSLIQVKYRGPLSIYAMYEPGEPPPSTLPQWIDFREELAKSPLGPTSEVIDFEVSSGFDTYCFKGEVIRDYLDRCRPPAGGDSGGGGGGGKRSGYNVAAVGGRGHGMLRMLRPSTLLWSDTSMRFNLNPSDGGMRLVTRNVSFAGFTAQDALAAMTHPKTFDFLGVGHPRDKYWNLTEDMYPGAGGTCFHVNLMDDSLVRDVLEPFLECGTRQCRACFAPPGSKKWPTLPERARVPGPYKYHRQDASVLSTLLYEWMHKTPDDGGGSNRAKKVSLREHYEGFYLRGFAARGHAALNASELNNPGAHNVYMPRLHIVVPSKGRQQFGQNGGKQALT